MTTLRTMRGLILGETWSIPLGVAVVVAAGVVLHEAAPSAWHDIGGFLLLAGVIVVLAATLWRTPR